MPGILRSTKTRSGWNSRASCSPAAPSDAVATSKSPPRSIRVQESRTTSSSSIIRILDLSGTATLRFRGRDRQADGKGCAVAHVAFHGNAAVVFLDDAKADGQPQTGPVFRF